MNINHWIERHCAKIGEHCQIRYSQNPVETTGITKLNEQAKDNMIKSELKHPAETDQGSLMEASR